MIQCAVSPLGLSRGRSRVARHSRWPFLPAPNRTYAYDAVGQLLSVIEPGKSGKANVAYTYDALGRQLTETSGGKTHAYTYDLANNRIKVTYGGTGTVLTSTYDVLNRLATLTEGSRMTTYGYDLNGNQVYQELPNGEETETIFDALNRRSAIVTTKSSGGTLLELVQAYDLVGNVVRITENYPGSTLSGRTVTNTYDRVNRLVGELNVEGPKTIATVYAFDKANNRSARAVATTTGSGTTIVDTVYIYNNLNQLVSRQLAGAPTPVATYGYDWNGNRATVGTSAGTDSYYYDYENRLVAIDKDSPGGTGTYAYVYDYRTRRVERTENATTTKLVFSGGVSVSEYTATTQSPLTYSPSPNAEYIRGSDWGGGVGGLLYSVRSGVPSFKHYNSRGDVISETNTAGARTWEGTYEAFGTRTQEVGTTQDRQKANTKEEDPTGLLNEGFRYRCLETGAFITRDPLGFVDGPNMYAYVVQNPWSKFDPEGLFEIYAESNGTGHVGFSTQVGETRVNYDYGRYAGTNDHVGGPAILKRTTGEPASSRYKNEYGSYKFAASPEMEARLATAFNRKFQAGQKKLPDSIKGDLHNPERGDLKPNERYLGERWSPMGPNCRSFTFETARSVFEQTQNDKNASDELKEEARALNEQMNKAEGFTPTQTKAKLDAMAKEGEVVKTSDKAEQPKEQKAEPKKEEKKEENKNE